MEIRYHKNIVVKVNKRRQALKFAYVTFLPQLIPMGKFVKETQGLDGTNCNIDADSRAVLTGEEF